MKERNIGLIEEEKKACATTQVRQALAEYLYCMGKNGVRVGFDGSATVGVDNGAALEILTCVSNGKLDYSPGMMDGLVDRITAAYNRFQEDKENI